MQIGLNAVDFETGALMLCLWVWVYLFTYVFVCVNSLKQFSCGLRELLT